MEKTDLQALVALVLVVLLGLGLAWAGSQESTIVLGMPLFALAVGLAFVIQWLGFIPAYLWQSERFFDLTGSLTYIVITTLAVFLTPGRDGRALLLMFLVVVWAVRLGSFLFLRIHKTGKDVRFDAIKPSFMGFLNTWTLQGLWVTFTLAVALAAITSTTRQALGGIGLLGVLVWGVGFAFEVVADWQKSRFRAQPENQGRFITSGLWAWSRHPNYFGEIVLWVGVTLIAMPVLRGWQLVTLISPVFVTLLLTRISGVPLLEQRADAKWGGQSDYEAYKAGTPVMLPRPPRKVSPKHQGDAW